MEHWELYLLFFVIATFYSSVGFGGGSSYLAILALFGVDFLLLRSSALLCNIIVVTGGTYIFYKRGHLKWKKAIPLVLMSVPLAFIGGWLPVREAVFFIILGMTLLVAGLLMWFQRPISQEGRAKDLKAKSYFYNMSIGSSIGFLAGIVGIGGGIFLAPVLHLSRWDSSKTIAATASLFILANSIAGLAGQMAKPEFQLDWHFVLPLMVAVLLGGQIGSRLGAIRLNQLVVKKATAALILFVSLRILIKYVTFSL
jgi:uncharacterized protein